MSATLTTTASTSTSSVLLPRGARAAAPGWQQPGQRQQQVLTTGPPLPCSGQDGPRLGAAATAASGSGDEAGQWTPVGSRVGLFFTCRRHGARLPSNSAGPVGRAPSRCPFPPKESSPITRGHRALDQVIGAGGGPGQKIIRAYVLVMSGYADREARLGSHRMSGLADIDREPASTHRLHHDDCRLLEGLRVRSSVCQCSPSSGGSPRPVGKHCKVCPAFLP